MTDITILALSKISKRKKLRSDFAVMRVEDFRENIKNDESFKNKFYTLWLFNKTDGNLVIDQEVFELKSNAIYFIKYHQVYQLSADENSSGYVLLFTKSFYNIIYTGNKIIKSETALSQLYSATHLKNENRKDVAKIFEQIKKEYEQAHPLFTEIICLLLKTLILNLLRNSRQEIYIHDQSDRKKNIVTSFGNLVDQHFKEYKTTSFYAKKLNLTSNYLNFIVKEQLGIPAGKLIRNRIILEAERLLLHTALSVTEISYELGFSDKSHFGKYFKADKNISPNQYRILKAGEIFPEI